MARLERRERNRAARSFRQLRRFHHVIDSDKVFGTHTVTNALKRLMQKTRSLSYCIGLVMVVLFVYGLIRYPDLPIRECPSGYCGRQGQPHTAAEYNAFSIWQTTLFIVWPIGMLIMLLLQRGKPKR